METKNIILDPKTAKALINADVLKFYGISGVETNLDIALLAPQTVQTHASSGNIYDLAVKNDNLILIPYKIVY